MVTASVGGSRLSSQVEGTANNKPGNTPSVVEASDPKKVETRPKRKGRRVEGFSEQEVVGHGHEARRRHLPIWANPFQGRRAALWRKGWRRPHDHRDGAE